MAAKVQTSADLLREAAARRALLVQSLEETRVKLQPSHLKAEASGQIKHMSSHVAEIALAKASTPLGLVATAATAALGVFALPRTRTSPPALAVEHDTGQPTVEGTAPVPRSAPGGGASLALNLALALGTGIVLHKLIPMSAQEKDLAGGVGENIRRFVDDWVNTQSSRLVNAPAGDSLSVTNLVALAVGLVAAAR